MRLIQKSFKNYWEHANADYFKIKYPSKSDDFIAAKLMGIAARNAGLLGGVTGLAVSIDEVIGIVQTVFSGGIGALALPANVAIAITAISGEAILLTRFQLQLIANLGKLYNVPLDPDDPEDILTILTYAVGVDCTPWMRQKVRVVYSERKTTDHEPQATHLYQRV